MTPCPRCRTPDLCAYDGCRNQPGTAVGPALAPLRPITLPALQRPAPPPEDYRPGRVVRALMALTDRAGEAVRRGPAPFAPEAEPAPDPRPLHEQVAEIMNAAVEPIPAAPKASPVQTMRGPLRRPEPGAKLTVRIAKSGAAVLIVGDEIHDAATDAAGLSAAVRAWYDGV